jgi:cholestenol delta-isomerase
MRHPYYPVDLVLSGYAPPAIPFQQVLAWFFGVCGTFFALTWILTGRFRDLKQHERITASWFAMTGVVHFIIEGYVVLHPSFYKDTSGGVLPEIWKEYTQADSRYATRDSFVISMEAVTAFVEGPACFLAVYGILARRPWAYTVQIMVSLGQIYGDVLYFATTVLEGLVHSRPEFLYFWFYFVVVNSVWIAIPSIVIFRAARAIHKAVAFQHRAAQTRKVS